MEISEDEQQKIASAIEHEIFRLDQIIKDYRSVREKPRNPSVRQMADEGMVSTDKRLKELRELLAKINPVKTGSLTEVRGR